MVRSLVHANSSPSFLISGETKEYMKIGIDISQLTYKNTGVANYLKKLVLELIAADSKNSYVLFYSSMRGKLDEDFIKQIKKPNVLLKTFKFPPVALDVMWNKLHIRPIESFIGPVDIFITSDWVEPPTKTAKKGTILYDLIVYKYPAESTPKIVETQKRKLKWVKKESDMIFCISQATKKDAKEILNITEDKLQVIYPGFTL
jgi:hypothetical protein